MKWLTKGQTYHKGLSRPEDSFQDCFVFLNYTWVLKLLFNTLVIKNGITKKLDCCTNKEWKILPIATLIKFVIHFMSSWWQQTHLRRPRRIIRRGRRRKIKRRRRKKRKEASCHLLSEFIFLRFIYTEKLNLYCILFLLPSWMSELDRKTRRLYPAQRGPQSTFVR